MNLLVIGAKLQGTEAMYLAEKAGYTVICVDKNRNAIGKNLCGKFICENVFDEGQQFIEALQWADYVLPTIEDDDVLLKIEQLKARYSLNVCFDFDAYKISSSKKKSNELMAACGVPMPVDYKKSKPPYIAKPSGGSGSQGVAYINNDKEYEEFLAKTNHGEGYIIQAYLTGKQYSVEVVGRPGSYRAYEITELYMDMNYDCKRVTAPCDLTEEQAAQLRGIGITIAEKLGLIGIMDVEAIYDNGVFRVLEIDARMPSQTPVVVYKTSGVNLLAELIGVYAENPVPQKENGRKLYGCYEHILADGNEIKAVGEHFLTLGGPVTRYEGLFESDECLTDFRESSEKWMLTLINSAETREKLLLKREAVWRNIADKKRRKLAYNDASPFDYS